MGFPYGIAIARCARMERPPYSAPVLRILRNIASVITYVSLLILEVVFRINASRDNSQPGRGSLDGSFVGGHPKRQSPRLPPLLVQVSQVYPLDKRGTCQTMNQVKRRPSSASQNWTPAYLVVRSTITESAVRFALCLDFQYSGGGGGGPRKDRRDRLQILCQGTCSRILDAGQLPANWHWPIRERLIG